MVMIRFFALLVCIIPQFVMGQGTVAPDPSMIKSIYFGGGSYYIDPYQEGELAKFIKSFSNIQDYDITVHSHTDNIGGAEFNEILSEYRSQSAVEKLLKLEISKTKIEVRDFGQFNPVYDNSTLEGRLRNRRVDIILWPKIVL